MSSYSSPYFFLIAGVAMWIAQHVMTVALQTTAMRQVARIRTKFLEAVLRQDIAWLV